MNNSFYDVENGEETRNELNENDMKAIKETKICESYRAILNLSLIILQIIVYHGFTDVRSGCLALAYWNCFSLASYVIVYFIRRLILLTCEYTRIVDRLLWNVMYYIEVTFSVIFFAVICYLHVHNRDCKSDPSYTFALIYIFVVEPQNLVFIFYLIRKNKR